SRCTATSHPRTAAGPPAHSPAPRTPSPAPRGRPQPDPPPRRHTVRPRTPAPTGGQTGRAQDAAPVADYSSELVSGLLQTADYASALRRAYLHHDDQQTTERWLAVRTKRQARLIGPRPGNLPGGLDAHRSG